jgi:hypothetical protein
MTIVAEIRRSISSSARFRPAKDAESTMSLTLVPGAYTAIVRGKNDTTGVALVEVYNLQ